WINEVLRAGGALNWSPVIDVRAEPIGAEKGYLSQTIRVRLAYDRPGAGPSSVVVKIEPVSGAFAEAARGVKAFAREIGFYADVAPRLRIRLPRVWYAKSLGDGCVLVMEDLTSLEALDQVHGVRHDQVLTAVRSIAVVHATYWNNPALAELGWLP